jgi:hypothetical protein
MEQYNLYSNVKGEPIKVSGTRNSFPAPERVIAAFHSEDYGRFYRACNERGYTPSSSYERRMYERGKVANSMRPEVRPEVKRLPAVDDTRFVELSRGLDLNNPTAVASALRRSGLGVLRGGTPVEDAGPRQLYAIAKGRLEAIERKRKGKK